MKQETIMDCHNLHKKPMKKYHATQIHDTVTGRYRWAVVRLANRLEKEWEEKLRIVAMARRSYTIGV